MRVNDVAGSALDGCRVALVNFCFHAFMADQHIASLFLSLPFLLLSFCPSFLPAYYFTFTFTFFLLTSFLFVIYLFLPKPKEMDFFKQILHILNRRVQKRVEKLKHTKLE